MKFPLTDQSLRVTFHTLVDLEIPFKKHTLLPLGGVLMSENSAGAIPHNKWQMNYFQFMANPSAGFSSMAS